MPPRKSVKSVRKNGKRYYKKKPYVYPLRNTRKSGSLGTVRKSYSSADELKFFDTSLAGSALTAPTDATGGEHNPATILCLNGVPQGDTMSTRDGSKMSMEKIYINGMVESPAANSLTAGTVGTTNVYIALVLDTQTNGGTATGIDSENVFSNPSAQADMAPYVQRNMSYTERYKVLKTKKIKIKPTVFHDGTDGAMNEEKTNFKISYNLGGLMTKFQTGTTTGYVGTIIDNSLHLIAYADNTTRNCALNYNSRLRFRG